MKIELFHFINQFNSDDHGSIKYIFVFRCEASLIVGLSVHLVVVGVGVSFVN